MRGRDIVWGDWVPGDVKAGVWQSRAEVQTGFADYFDGLASIGVGEEELEGLSKRNPRAFVEALHTIADEMDRRGRGRSASLWRAWARKEERKTGRRGIGGLGH